MIKKFTLSFVAILFIATSVFSQGSVSFTADVTSGCAPLNVTFTNNSTIDTTGVSFYWNFNDGYDYEVFDTSHTFYAGYYNVSLNAFNQFGNYIGGFNMSIEVQGSPNNFYISTGNNVCPGESITFGSYGGSWNTSWNLGDGTIGTDYYFTHSYSNTGNYDVMLVAENQCGIDTIVEQIIVSDTAIPYININVNGGNQFCPNDVITFNNQYSTSNYLWNFGDGTFSANPSPEHAFSSIGDYDVILTVTNSCGNSNKDTFIVSIQNGLLAYSDFNYWPNPACPSQSVSFNTWMPGTYQWNFGDGTTSNLSSDFHAYSDTGTYTIQLIASNGCGDKDTTYKDIQVQYQQGNIPNAYLYFDNFNNWNQYGPVDTITMCTNTLVQFMNATGGGNLTYMWDFGDGNTATTVDAENTFESVGLFEVKLIAINECGGKDTAYKWINVRDDLLPESSLNALPTVICPGESVLFFDDRYNEQNQYVYSIWFGDGDSLVNFMNETDTIYEVLANHVYNNAGTYNAVFTVQNSCGNVNTSNYTIIVDSTGTYSTQYFVGNSTSENNNGPNQFNDWSIPSGEPEHTITFPASFSQWQQGMNEDMYIVCWYGGMSILGSEMGAPNGMIQLNASENNTVTVYAPVNADSLVIAGIWYCNQPFNSDPDAYGILGAFKLEVDADTTIAAPGLVIANWDGDCVPQQTGNNPDAACIGDLVEFFAVGGVQHEWHFGDGDTATGLFATHAYADTGIYNAFVKITNSCGVVDSVYTIVEIGNYNLPNGNMSIDGRWTCTNSPVTFRYYENNGNVDFYNYLWSFGDGNYSTELNPTHYYSNGGQYIINLTVTNGCGSINFIDTVWISSNNIQYLSYNGCNGENNGYIELSSELWGNNNTFEWSNGATTESIYNLLPGSYTVTVSGSNICTHIETFIIEAIQPVSIAFNITNETCPGNNDGQAEAVVTGGDSPYYYFWFDGSESNSIQNLTPGNYNITVLDANACNATNNVDVLAAVPLATSISVTDAICYGGNGIVDLTVTGGTTPYYFAWSGAYTTEDLTEVGADDYFVTVTDSNGCIATDNATMNQSTDVVMSEAVTNANCGASDGSIDLTVSGGTTPYSYSWSNGGSTEDLTGLSAGYYVVTLSDANGCTKYNTYGIANPGAPSINNINITYVTCNGDVDGAITLTISDGVTPYSFLWSTAETTQDISSLSGGNYSVTITDASNCQVINPQINVYEPELISTDSIVTNISCNGLSDGVIEINVNGGNGSNVFVWSNSETSNINSNLASGTYYFTVTDTKGCVYNDSSVVSEPTSLTANLVPTNNLCNGDLTGSVDLTATGGITPYTYIWDNSSNSEDLNAISAGIYNVTVYDANMCSYTDAVTISEPSAIISMLSGTDVLCNGESNGSVDLTVSGGTTSYSYLWSNAEVSEDLSNVPAGIYVVEITDANMCTKIDTFEISEPDFLFADAVISNISCNGANDGSFDITIYGGVSPYTVLWSNDSTIEDIYNLSSGYYSGTLTDANGCIFTDGNTIYEPAILVLNPTAENNNCYGDIDGTAYANPSGGTAPYSYAWSVAGNGNSVINLPAGEYFVTVTDFNGCTQNSSVNISTPDSIAITYVVTNAATTVSSDGAINLTVSGGIVASDYSYTWSTTEISQDIINLLWGYYYVTVSDDNGCFAYEGIYVDFIDAINSLNGASDLFKVYPNPNNGKFFIQNSNKAEIRIYNTIGELVIKVNSRELLYELDFSNMPKGIYTINAKFDNGKYVSKRLIIE